MGDVEIVYRLRAPQFLPVAVLQIVNPAAVLGVDHGHAASFRQEVHRPEQMVVVGVPFLLHVGQEELEGADAQFHNPGDFGDLARGLKEATVKAEVQPGAGPTVLQHPLHLLQEALSGAGVGEVEEGGDAAVGRQAGAGLHVVLIDGVDVDVHRAGEDVHTGDVHHFAGGVVPQVRGDGGDRLAAHAHVGPPDGLAGHQQAAGEEKVKEFGHSAYSVLRIP
jgi:hypothetical protein